MRSEEEIRRVLQLLEKEHKIIEEGDTCCHDVVIDGIKIYYEAYGHDGICEWIRALKWVLGLPVEEIC